MRPTPCSLGLPDAAPGMPVSAVEPSPIVPNVYRGSTGWKSTRLTWIEPKPTTLVHPDKGRCPEAGVRRPRCYRDHDWRRDCQYGTTTGRASDIRMVPKRGRESVVSRSVYPLPLLRSTATQRSSRPITSELNSMSTLSLHNFAAVGGDFMQLQGQPANSGGERCTANEFPSQITACRRGCQPAWVAASSFVFSVSRTPCGLTTWVGLHAENNLVRDGQRQARRAITNRVSLRSSHCGHAQRPIRQRFVVP
jgi:hypothetical protein